MQKNIRTVFVTIASFALVVTALNAWNAPSVAPPGGNTAAPVNVSSIGQGKDGSLSVKNFAADSVTVGSKINSGSITSPQFCIGDSCITAWPSGSTTGGDTTGGNTTGGDTTVINPKEIVMQYFASEGYSEQYVNGDEDRYGSAGRAVSDAGDTCNGDASGTYICKPSEARNCFDVAGYSYGSTGSGEYGANYASYGSQRSVSCQTARAMLKTDTLPYNKVFASSFTPAGVNLSTYDDFRFMDGGPSDPLTAICAKQGMTLYQPKTYVCDAADPFQSKHNGNWEAIGYGGSQGYCYSQGAIEWVACNK